MADNIGSIGFNPDGENEDFFDSMTVFGLGFRNTQLSGSVNEVFGGNVLRTFAGFVGLQTEGVSGND